MNECEEGDSCALHVRELDVYDPCGRPCKYYDGQPINCPMKCLSTKNGDKASYPEQFIPEEKGCVCKFCFHC